MIPVTAVATTEATYTVTVPGITEPWLRFPVHTITSSGECSCGKPECWERRPDTGKPNGSPGKHPRTKNGLKDASADPAKISAWESRWPGTNWAARTGPESAFWVLDIDGADGLATLGALEAEHGPLPATLTATTGSGGRHYLFRWPARRVPNSCRKLGPGLDVRGDGGYIVIAPANHWSGGVYAWDNDLALADAPPWLLDVVCGAKPAPTADTPQRPAAAPSGDGRAIKYAAAAFDGEVAAVRSAREGTRNQTLNNAALALGTFVGSGLLSEGLVRSALTAAALAAGLPMPEITATINSGLKAGMANPRDIPERTYQPRQHQGAPPRPESDPETGEIYDRDPRPEPPPIGEPSADSAQAPAPDNVSVDLLVKMLPPKLRARITEPTVGDRSRNLYFVIRALAEKDVPDTLIESIIRANPQGVGAKYVDRNDLSAEVARVKASKPFNKKDAPNANDVKGFDETEDAAAADSLDDLVDPRDLDGVEPPEREWVVEEWLPRKTVSLLTGTPGCGKTLLAQQLSASTALGVSFLGLDTIQCKTLAFFCEDDNDELHRRGRSICYHYGVSLSQLSDIRWQGRFGKPNVLATFGYDGLIQPTEFFDFIITAMEHTGADLLILDNVAQLFGGNENDRSQVTQFVNQIGEIAVRFNCAILLLAHPGKSEIGLTSQYSGSTAWDACVRSRWMLARPKSDAEQDARELSDIRILTKGKANYSTIGDEITLKWDKGAFAVVGGAVLKDTVDRIDERNQEREDNERFLRCLDILASQEKTASHVSNSPSFAPKVMVKLDPWKGQHKATKRIQAAMDRLFNSQTILANQLLGKKPNRHPLVGIARKGASDIQNAGAEPASGPSQVIDIACVGSASGVASGCAESIANPLENHASGCVGSALRQSPHTPLTGQWPDLGIGHGPVAEVNIGATSLPADENTPNWGAEL